MKLLVYFSLTSRNSATETVEQELLFVGQESGKLIAIRDIIQKVRIISQQLRTA
jgi:ATP-dependent RNA helicase DDX52/ROK1